MNEFVAGFEEFLTSVWFLRLIYAAIAAVILFVVIKLYLFLRRRAIERLRYSRAFSASGAYEGEGVVLTETIYNDSWFPLFFVNIEGFIYGDLKLTAYPAEPEGGMQYFISRFHLMPHMQTRRHHDIVCLHRGYFHLETVECRYQKRTKYFDAPAELYVYPRIVPYADVPYPTGSEQGEILSQRRLIADPFQFSGIRDYRFGDPFNSINFKASAKSGYMGGLRVNNREFAAARVFMVYLNFQTEQEESIPTRIYNDMMEYGLSLAAAIVREGATQGYRVGFASNCNLVTGENHLKFPIGSGMEHMEDIMREMAKVRPSAGISFTHLLETDMHIGMTHTELFVITPYLDERIAAQFSHLEMAGNYVHLMPLTYEGQDKDEKPKKAPAPDAEEGEEAVKNGPALSEAPEKKRMRARRQ